MIIYRKPLAWLPGIRKMRIRRNISGKYCPRFGQIAVEKGYITEQQLKEALCCQIEDDVSGKDHRLLGTILFDKGWMSVEQIEEVLKVLL